jgi:hypothetical protein
LGLGFACLQVPGLRIEPLHLLLVLYALAVEVEAGFGSLELRLVHLSFCAHHGQMRLRRPACRGERQPRRRKGCSAEEKRLCSS